MLMLMWMPKLLSQQQMQHFGAWSVECVVHEQAANSKQHQQHATCSIRCLTLQRGITFGSTLTLHTVFLVHAASATANNGPKSLIENRINDELSVNRLKSHVH
ncbi:GH17405 [Drosophila grimshawi]|uniref:GH17405 n=1 Tax=Drosophila grimshawi TaxID=7222 RepID=B4JV52_DROGR|nr:GH17405 [Drosophila grimshawi]